MHVPNQSNFLIPRFYNAYKKSSAADFKSFFRNYRPEFVPRETDVSLPIEVLDQAHYKLKDRWPQLASHTYMAACRVGLSNKWESHLEDTFKELYSKTRVDYALMTMGVQHSLGKTLGVHEKDIGGYRWGGQGAMAPTVF